MEVVAIESQDVLGWKGLQSPFSPKPLSWAGLLLPAQAAQGPIQPGLEHLQGWGTHNLSGQTVPLPNYPLSKEFPPNVQPKSLIF